ncbi:alpha/beta fold hydrolase [Brevibacterium sp. p3-SID960]|uniref:alpha/beta fold hydrolase n=1 Tax=Brevibacterium sp. p3-SID960 TaxID=2916063 RepID=UPI0021A971CE|nr:alpha/beta fold hydrolase [Brevibacterium sp. p3-SID960]MCT1690534.1 alpha/beta fold hydrolase [Brevibacterium sp. p3-SID960]
MVRLPGLSPRLPARPAQTPGELPGWDEQWSRLVTVGTVDGERTFHVLDTLPALQAEGLAPAGTILALHGNPTWSYLWRHLAAASLDRARGGGPVWRVIAPDQLEMGFSERLAHTGLPTTHGPGFRRIAERVADFDAVATELLAESPTERTVTLGHDWGGVLSLTWAARNQDRIDAVVSLNTAVAQPEGTPIPAPLQAALAGPMLPLSTVRTDWFLRTTLALAQGSLSDEEKDAFRAPYRTAELRGGIGAFVADVPAVETHPSYAELQRLGDDIAGIDLPALLIWGPKDPVFLERFLRDLRHRLPQADIHRCEKASHLVSEDADVAGIVLDWLTAQFGAPSQAAGAVDATDAVGTADATGAAGPADNQRPATSQQTAAAAPMIFDALAERADDEAIASVDMSQRPPQSVSWRQLSSVVDGIAAGLQARGLAPGDRVSLLVTPGNNLTAAAYGVLKAGGTVVVADAGLGVAGMTRAIRSADPQWIIGELPGLTLARTAGWPGRRVSISPLPGPERLTLNVETSLTELIREGHAHLAAGEPLRTPAPADLAAVLFTSGSTGPAKGVRYTHAQLSALMDVLTRTFGMRPGAGLVAGFAPFALFGPGLGATSVTPDMSVTKPRTLTAAALADAIAAADCTMVFASPAAYTNVCATAAALTEAQRAACAGVELALSAGAPVPLSLMDQVAEIFPHAQIHSPYGMTEGLLLADIDRHDVAAAEAEGTARTGATSTDGFARTDGTADAGPGAQAARGVCVGTPIDGVRFALAPIDADGRSADELLTGTDAQQVLGEFVVSAAHIRDGYDRLWSTDQQAGRDTLDGQRWHRTNDIGHIDAAGRIWLEGRLQHIITTPAGPLGPGGIEALTDRDPAVLRSAAVGVGPTGTQALVLVLEPAAGSDPESGEPLAPGLAPLPVAQRLRAHVAAATGADVAAVLIAPSFPTDIRHNSKIDRSRLADWAAAVLGGEPIRTP